MSLIKLFLAGNIRGLTLPGREYKRINTSWSGIVLPEEGFSRIQKRSIPGKPKRRSFISEIPDFRLGTDITHSHFNSALFNYLCIYDLYGPVCNVFDAG
jgi:hypothetical protein